MVIAELKKTTDQKMDKTIQAFKADLAKVRTGRAHTGLLDHIQVDYYGTPTPINQVARITLIDARTIGVAPFEKKMIQAVDKAIRESDLGLNPAAQGRAPPRPGGGGRDGGELRRARRRIPDALCLQLRELASAGRGGGAPPAALPERVHQRSGAAASLWRAAQGGGRHAALRPQD